MAKSSSAVTSVQVNNTEGPVYYNASSTIAVTYETDFNAAASGWIDLGYGSTDGAEIEQKADSSDKKVWGANLGTTYSNFKDTATIHAASYRSKNTLSVLFGADNVESNNGVIHVKVKSRQGTKGTFVIVGRDDDGNKMLWVYRGQTSPEVSYDLKEDDIISYDLKISGISQSDGTTSEMYISDPEYTAPSSTSAGAGK